MHRVDYVISYVLTARMLYVLCVFATLSRLRSILTAWMWLHLPQLTLAVPMPMTVPTLATASLATALATASVATASAATASVATALTSASLATALIATALLATALTAAAAAAVATAITQQ